MTRPRLGALRHRVTLEAVMLSPDGGGGASETWVSLADLWAAVEPTSGTEGLSGEGLAGRVSHRVRLRYRDDIAPPKRFRFGDRVLDIIAVINPDERGRFLDCYCRESGL